ncbi:MAG: YbhB/YbcL family Raf kinase inhibitor-like protein [Haloarculaceae archaeon]
MFRRRDLLATVGAGLAIGFSGCSTGADGDATDGSPAPDSTVGDLSVTSPAFGDGEPIPPRYTPDGANVSPPLSIAGVPSGASALAVVVDDPDAPGGRFVHWLLWNLPADRTSIPSGVPRKRVVPPLGDARQGTNGFGRVGYDGPRPPRDGGPHTYRVTVSALDHELAVPAGARRERLSQPLAAATVAAGRLTGTYER